MPKAYPSFPMLPTGNPARIRWINYINRLHAIWAGHSIRAYGAYESVVQQRVDTAKCLDDYRKYNIIK